jgi:hypothetical protein
VGLDMVFNLKRYAQEIEQNNIDEPIEEIEPVEDNNSNNSDMVNNTPTLEEPLNAPLDEPKITNTEQIEEAQKVDYTQSAFKVVNTFKTLFEGLGLDQLSEVVGDSEAQSLLSQIIEQTKQKIEQKLGA